MDKSDEVILILVLILITLLFINNSYFTILLIIILISVIIYYYQKQNRTVDYQLNFPTDSTITDFDFNNYITNLIKNNKTKHKLLLQFNY